MTIDEAYRFVNYICNKESSGQIGADSFNLLAPVAQMSVVNDRLGNVKKYKYNNPQSEYGWGINEKIMEELKALYISTQNTFITPTAFEYPSDCIYIDSIVDDVTKAILKPVGSQDVFRFHVQSQIKPPVTAHGIYFILNSQIAVFPEYSAITTYYVKRPATPIRNYTLSNDRDQYAATGGIIGDGLSQNFELSETTHLEICMKILQMSGVNLALDRVLAYSMAEEAKGA